jgi:hypothetical protein
VIQKGIGAKPGAYLLQPGKEALLVAWRYEAGRIELTVKHRGSGSAEEWVLFCVLIRDVLRPCELLRSLLSSFGPYDH